MTDTGEKKLNKETEMAINELFTGFKYFQSDLINQMDNYDKEPNIHMEHLLIVVQKLISVLTLKAVYPHYKHDLKAFCNDNNDALHEMNTIIEKGKS